MIETGIRRLDEILGGGLLPGSSTAFLGSVERDNIIFMHQIVQNLLRKGYRVLLVEFRQPMEVLTAELKHYGIQYDEFTSSGRLLILDGFSNLYGPTSKQGPNVIPNPLDLGITSAIIRDTAIKGKYDLLVIDDLTSQYALQSDKKLYIRAIIKLINSIKNAGISVFGAVLGDVFEKSELAMSLLPWDYIFEVSNGFISIKRTIQPIRVPFARMPYVKSEDGIQLAWESYEDLETIKRNLTLDEEGNLWFEGERIQLIGEESEASLIEFAYRYLGPKEGKRFLYLWGRYEFRGVGKAYRNFHRSLRDALDYFSKATKASGGGILEPIELRDDFIVIRGKNLFPLKKGSQYPLHVNYAGEIAQLISEFTGEEWEGDEVKCQATGAEYCEFVFRKKSTGNRSSE
ncbi:MAG: uncharacterized protein PWQ79_1205 [Thermococcaceae archaeon]|nr:uncharacterized protein [Thermococcaceae archaeon]